MDDEGLQGGPGDAFYRFFLVFPVLLTYLVFNLISLSAIIERVRQTGRLNALYIWLAIAILWIATFRYDDLRSFRVICLDTGCQVSITFSAEKRRMSAIGRFRSCVTIRDLSVLATCYTRSKDRERPTAVVRVVAKTMKQKERYENACGNGVPDSAIDAPAKVRN